MSDENSRQSMIGRQFGPYPVVELLGKGGMARAVGGRFEQRQDIGA
jgi:hypothetical protein